MERYPNIFFGGASGQPSTSGSSHAPSSTSTGNLNNERNQQLADLLAAFPACRPFGQDSSSYRSMMELPFKMPDGRTMGMLVALPPTFPRNRPILTVSQPIIHPWVGYGGQLTFPSLSAWRYPASRLRAVVEEACSGLGGQPTTAATAAAAGAGAGLPPPPPHLAGAGSAQQGPSSTGSIPGRASSEQHRPPSSAGGAAAAVAGGAGGGGGGAEGAAGAGLAGLGSNEPLPDSFPELHAMTSSELAAALHDESAFESLLQAVMASSQSAQARGALSQANLEAAQRNLQKEAALSDIRNQVAVIRSADYTGAAGEFRERREKVESLVSKVTPAALMSKLQEAAQQADSESTALAKRFMAGGVPVEEFVEGYGDLRALYHKRDLKRQAAMQSSVL